MGTVNTGLTRFSATYRTIESIHPSFNADTPLYLVVDAMVMDRAEYDVDVRLGDNSSGELVDKDVSVMWKSYPENGRLHVSIDTSYDNDKVIRTVKCITEYGRIYTKKFTKRLNDTTYYNGRYSNVEGIALDSLSVIAKVISNPQTMLTELGIDAGYYGKIFSNTGLYERDIPYILNNDLIMDFAWSLIYNKAPWNVESLNNNVIYPPIPELDMDTKINIFSKCYDIESLANVLFLHLYGYTTEYSTNMASICNIGKLEVVPRTGEMKDVEDMTLYDVIAIYLASHKWKSDGWIYNYNDESNCCNPFDCDLNNFNAGLYYKTNASCKEISNFAKRDDVLYFTDFNIDKMVYPISNTNPVAINVDNINKVFNTIKEYSKLHIPTEPVISSIVRQYHIEKYAYAGLDNIHELFDTCNMAVRGDVNISEFDSIICDMHIRDDYSWCMDISGTMPVLTADECTIITNTPDIKTFIGLPTKTVNYTPGLTSIQTHDAFINIDNTCAPIYGLSINGKSIEQNSVTKNPDNPVEVKEAFSNGYIQLESVNDALYDVNNKYDNDDIIELPGYESYYITMGSIYRGQSIDNTKSDLMLTLTFYTDGNDDVVKIYSDHIENGNRCIAETSEFSGGRICIKLNVPSDFKWVNIIKSFSVDITITPNENDYRYMSRKTINIPISEPLRSLYIPSIDKTICDRLYRENGYWKIMRNIMKYNLCVKNVKYSYTTDAEKTIFVNDLCVNWVYDESASRNGKYIYHLSGYGIDGVINENDNDTISTIVINYPDIMCPFMIVQEIPYGVTSNIPLPDSYAISITKADSMEYDYTDNKHYGTNFKFVNNNNLIDCDIYGNSYGTNGIINLCIVDSSSSTPEEILFNFIENYNIYFYGVIPYIKTRRNQLMPNVDNDRLISNYPCAWGTETYAMINREVYIYADEILDAKTQKLLNTLPIQNGYFKINDDICDTYSLTYVTKV